MSSELKLTSFDHVILKQSLIDFLKSTKKFDDFNFEGSAINTLIDLLVRNSLYDAFLADMVANESFINTAQKRQNVVAHASKLSYTPRSCTSAKMVSDVSVKPSTSGNNPRNIVMEAGSQFLTSIDGVTYTFTNIHPYTTNMNDTQGVYLFKDVELYQGQLLSNRFVYSGKVGHLVIPNDKIDTSTLIVTASNPETHGGEDVYQLASTIEDTKKDKNVFFLEENYDGLYEVSFGRNVLGKEPREGSIITVTYINTEKQHANGAKSLDAATLINGLANITVNVKVPSFGGYDRESIDSIRWKATKFYQSQDRAVSSYDYVTLLEMKYPFIEKAKAWGGEENIPPQYGSVFISVLTNSGGRLTTSVKKEMAASLKEKNVGSITPIIIDPELIGLDLNVLFKYDDRKTSFDFQGLSESIKNKIREYDKEYNNRFDSFYNQSKLESSILNIPSVTSVDIHKRAFKNIKVLKINNPVYEVNFGNSIKKESVSMKDFVIDMTGVNHKLYDDGKGVVFVQFDNQDGTSYKKAIGTVDYEKGVVEFILNVINPDTTIKLYVEPIEDNFYVKQNRISYIHDINTSLMKSY